MIPAQDVLTLGQNARLNTPGTTSGNWTWRLKEELLQPLAEGIKRLFD
ncbi:MAG: 4-alpha-glucanotransferase [Clostridia bacterium]|nr:4-alpha-glucanotransferase [Clostridia bacterium]